MKGAITIKNSFIIENVKINIVKVMLKATCV